jgi:hypothetical protein
MKELHHAHNERRLPLRKYSQAAALVLTLLAPTQKLFKTN